MDFSTLFNSLQDQLGQSLPSILGALAILIGGWFIAVLVRAGLRRLLTAIGINKRIADSTGQSMDIAGSVSLAAFIIIVVITMIAVFNLLNLNTVSEPFTVLISQFFEYLPRLIGGLVLGIVAFSAATIIKLLTTKALASTTMDEKLSLEAGMQPMSNNVGNMLFWIVILMFLSMILETLGLSSMMLPVQGMVDKFLLVLPNILGAGVIAFVGWVVAKVVRGLVTNILATTGVDKLSQVAGIEAKNNIKISNILGTLVFAFVFIPSLIAALDTLEMDAIAGPASDMLSTVFAAIPNILVAGLILVIAYFVGKFASNLVTNLLTSIGFNNLPSKLGFGDAFTKTNTPSTLIGKIVIFFVLLFATVEAANRLGFGQVSEIVSVFIQFGGDILLGSVILLVGFWLANLAYSAIDKASGKQSSGLASVARIAIIGLVVAMGLRAMGIADDIVNMAFAFTFGAIAVAVALAFGLGGREAAGKQLEYWFKKMRDGDK